MEDRCCTTSRTTSRFAVEAIAILVIAVGTVEAVVGVVRAVLSPRVDNVERLRSVWLEFAHWLVAASRFSSRPTSSTPRSRRPGTKSAVWGHRRDPHVPELFPRSRGREHAQAAARGDVAEAADAGAIAAAQ